MITFTPKELVEHLKAAGLSPDRVQVRGECIVFRGKDDQAIAINAEAARITFPVEEPAPAKPALAKRRRSRHVGVGD